MILSSTTRRFNRDYHRSVAGPVVEATPPKPPSREEEEIRAALEAELRAATREYEDELLAKFDQFPKWITNNGGQVCHYYWNGQKWVEYDLNDPHLWVAENIDPDSL